MSNPDPIAVQKAESRRLCRAQRAALSEAQRLQASQAICCLIEEWPIFRQSRVVLTYMPMRQEVDLTALLDRWPEKVWVLPRLGEGPERQMTFHAYHPLRLIRHRFGMLEPAPDLPLISPQTIHLALVPGLAFDRHGWRLGYGGGYFDRFLRGFSGVSLGVTYQALLVDDLPHDEFDVPVQWIVTEAGLFAAGAV